jgi:hypothetical protein
MAIEDLPPEFDELSAVVIDAIRRAYDINAERHDPEAGDDAVVFGIGVYRNSWFLTERAVDDLEHWRSARPNGSLVVMGCGLRVHVYRHGRDADADLEAFRLDDARASETQRLIAEANTLQLALPFDLNSAPTTPADAELCELVIIHAGNPDDGCCGIWVGAPIATEEITVSPWAWIRPLWRTGEAAAAVAGNERDALRGPRHDELPEPEILLQPVVLEGDAEER